MYLNTLTYLFRDLLRSGDCTTPKPIGDVEKSLLEECWESRDPAPWLWWCAAEEVDEEPCKCE